MDANIQRKTKKPTYIVFPLWLLEGVDVDCIHEIAFKIFCFAVYPHSKKLTYGTPERMIASAATYYGFHMDMTDRRIHNIRSTGEMLLNNLRPGYPLASVPIKKLIEYINFDKDINFEKSELDVVCLLAYASLRSIAGESLVWQTSKIIVLSRMAGNPITINEQALPPFLQKYLIKWHFDKIIFELKHNWGVAYYAQYTRGFYFSFDLKLKYLVEAVEKNRKQYLIKSDKQAQWEAREQALKKLNRGNNESDQSSIITN